MHKIREYILDTYSLDHNGIIEVKKEGIDGGVRPDASNAQAPTWSDQMRLTS